MSILERMPSATQTHSPLPLPPRDCWGEYPLPLALRLQEDDLPIDPRVWNRQEVAKWVSRRGGQPDRFPMNGKALCLMTQKMFQARVPHQQSAVALHHDFKRRLAKALALQDFIDDMTSK
ncbi:sterile alpha motif (SAM)/Pointed domain-containing protein [Phthorimaea operculella]|nr:sterile alpha motif (SAM)/Pointed domain-containing protein [Phthorimaea operculella]